MRMDIQFVQSWELCVDCKGVGFDLLPPKQFEKSAPIAIGSSTCNFCELLGNSITISCPRSVQPVGDLVADCWKPDGHKVTLVTVTMTHGSCKQYIIYSLPSFPKSLAEKFGIAKDQYFAGWNKVQLARRWLTDSVKMLPALSPEDLTLPKRVLDLSKSHNPLNEDFIRLVTTEEIKGRYIALSHRWSPEIAIKTTTETLSARRRKILIKDLPNTFRDAVILSRMLEVKYLWIDALCIIQDSTEDWEEQSQLMGGIYSNAHCTIAAHAAKNTDSGFLHLSLSRPQTFEFGNSRAQRFGLRQPSNFYQDIETSKLNQRGWVLQERYLSKRILHMSVCLIYWEDARGFRTEDIAHEKLPRNEVRFQERINVTEDDREPKMTPLVRGHMDGPDGMPDWEEMIERYSRCSLTFPSDKVHAISGIVKVLAKQLQIRRIRTIYAVGLWTYRSHRDLLWYGLPSGTRLQTTDTPSWSWASYDGAIKFAARDSVVFGENFRPDCKFLDGNPEGPESGLKCWLQGPCSLTLRTSIRAVHFMEGKKTQEQIGGQTIVYLCKGDRTWEPELNSRGGAIYDEHDIMRTVGFVVFDQDVKRPIDVQGYCAKIARGDAMRPVGREYVSFLILRRVSGGSEPEYNRIGMGVTHLDTWLDLDLEDILIK